MQEREQTPPAMPRQDPSWFPASIPSTAIRGDEASIPMDGMLLNGGEVPVIRYGSGEHYKEFYSYLK